MTKQEMFELAVNLYILIITEPDQGVAHVRKVKEELSAKGQWEQFASQIMQGMHGDDFNHRVRTEAEQRMAAND